MDRLTFERHERSGTPLEKQRNPSAFPRRFPLHYSRTPRSHGTHLLLLVHPQLFTLMVTMIPRPSICHLT